MARIRTLLILLFLVLTLYYAAGVEIVGTPDVTIYEGENATLSCTISCSMGENYVFWSTRQTWLAHNRLNLHLLGSRASRFNVSVFHEMCNANATLKLTSTLSIVDVAEVDAGLYECNVAGTNVNSSIELKVVPLYLSKPTCSRIPMFAVVGDLVTVVCVSEHGGPFTQLRLYTYDEHNHKKRVLKTTNLTLSHTHTITSDDDVAYFICETKFIGRWKNQERRRCITNTIHVIRTTSVQVLPLNNTPFHPDDQVCFICVITSGSLQDVEYSWSRSGHGNETRQGSSQHCIDKIRPEDDQQLIICNVSNKYHPYATGNTTIKVAMQPETLTCSDRSFRWELLLWLLLPTNICLIITIVLLVTCTRKRKHSGVEILQLSRSIDGSVPTSTHGGFDHQEQPPRPTDEHDRGQKSPQEDQELRSPDLSDRGRLYQAVIDAEVNSRQRSPDVHDQRQPYLVVQDPIYNDVM